MLVLHWWEHAPYGPAVEYLISAADMGEIRAECGRAALYHGPPDRRTDSVARNDPLIGIAASHPGTLLWRLDGQAEWTIGAESAAAWRSADIAAFNETQQAARARRSTRRHSR